MADREPKVMIERLEAFGFDSLNLYAQTTIQAIKEKIEADPQALSLQEGSELERIYEHYCQP